MAKPDTTAKPTNDPQLESRVAALEARMTTAETDILEVDARVTTLEEAEDGGEVEPPPIDPPDPEPEPEPGTRVPLSVDVLMGGVTTTLNESNGVELDSYVDPEGKFTQRCIKVTNSALPDFVMHVRPDLDGKREEVVFELGRVRSAASIIMSDFRVVIRQGETVLYDETIADQWYRSRWRWQSEPRPVRHTVAELMTAGYLPHYTETLATNTPASSVQSYTPMGFAGITTTMGGTGERPDIGPMTEWQADYICTGRNLETVLAQAEACNSFPWWYRDENTDAPIDTFVETKASSYNSSEPSPYLFNDWRINPDNPDAIVKIQCDTAHHPNLSYLPYLLCGDPYYLEGLHTIVNYNILAQPWNGRMYDIYFAIRAHAWALRCAAEAVKVTPEVTPNWMLPKSYFVKHLNGNRDWMTATYLHPTGANAPAWTLFCTTEQSFGDNDESPQAPQGTYSQTYMEEFSAFIICWVVQLGFEDWRPIAEWKIKNTIARTDGKSGWVRAISTPYRENLRPAKTEPWCASWKDSWDLTNARYNFTYTDPNVLAIGGNDISYPTYTEGALAIAKSIGIAAAEPSHTWIHDQVNKLIATTTQRYRARKWCISGS